MRRSLLVLLLIATALRLWGIDFGLDLHDVRRTVLSNQVDERGMVDSELHGLLAGNFHPGDFLHRGAGAYYLFGAVDAAVLAPLALLGEGGWAGQRARLEANPSLLFLVHRLVSALAGVLTVALMVRMCRRELGPRAALLGGALLAVAYLHVRESHFGTVDALWALLTLATVDQLLLLLRDPSARRYALAGLLVGVTAATKYFGAVLVLHLLAAHLLARAAARRGGAAPGSAPGAVRSAADRKPPGIGRLLLGLFCVPAGFVALSPYLFFAAGDLLAMVRWSMENIGAEPSGGGVLAALAAHGRWTLGAGLGEPALLLALVGLVLGWRRGGGARALALFALLLLPTILVTSHHPVRFGLALLVLLVPLAALAGEALLARVLRARAPRAAPAAPGLATALLAVLLLPSLVRSVAFDSLVARPDTRLEMLEALAERGASTQDVLAFGLYGLPRAHESQPPPFIDVYRAALRGGAFTPQAVAAAPPRFILRDLCSGLPDATGWDAWAPLVAERYQEVLRLEPRPERDAVPLPDPLAGTPGHMLPYANPWAMRRPGSALVLYERIPP